MISDTQTAFAITFSTPASIDTGSSLFIKDSRVNDDGAYVLYRDQSTNELFIAFSDDQGATWNITTVDNTGFVDNQNARILFDDSDNLGIVYHRNDAGDQDIVFRSSTNNGATFFPEVSISTVDESSFDIDASNDGDNILVTFGDDQNNEWHGAYVSNDFGTTWSNLIVLQGEATGGFGCVICEFDALEHGHNLVHGMNMYASWMGVPQAVGDTNAYFTKSNDNGATWDTPIQLNTLPIDNFAITLTLEEDSGNILVSWIDNREFQIQARSTNGGTSFFTEELVTDDEICQEDWSIVNLELDVFWVCNDSQDDTDGGVYFTKSDDFGVTYDPSVRIPFLNATNLEFFPFGVLKATGDNLYFLNNWNALIDPNAPLYLSFSQDRGNTWGFELIGGMNGTVGYEREELDGAQRGSTAVFEDQWFYFTTGTLTSLDFVYSTIVNNGTALDTDGDGIPDETDTDDDNDGIEDIIDPAPLDDTNDSFDDGSTSGTIVRGDQDILAIDLTAPDGVRISSLSSAVPASGITTTDQFYTCGTAGENNRDIHLRNKVDGVVISSNTVSISGLPLSYMGCNGLAQDPTDEQWYIIAGMQSGNRNLATIDPSTGIGTSIGAMGDNYVSLTISFIYRIYDV